MIRTAKLLSRLLIAGVILTFISSCIRRDIGQILDHPTVSLVKADVTVGLNEPVWSPDGGLLAATGIEVCLTGRCDYGVFILDLQTRELYPLLDIDLQSRPAWTTDPEVISFVQTDESVSGIHTIDLNSNKREFVANGNWASWSLDGKFVAIARGKGPTRPDGYTRPSVSILNLATGEETQIFEVPQAAEEIITGLSWSPDSNQLALSAQWWTLDTAYSERIFVVNADGTNLHQVTDDAKSPGWMPDGEWFYFLMGDGRLGFAPLDFSCVITPLEIPGISSASISPSGEQMAFAHDANIYLLDLNELLGPNREKLVCSE